MSKQVLTLIVSDFSDDGSWLDDSSYVMRNFLFFFNHVYVQNKDETLLYLIFANVPIRLVW